jgi:hypothetical protein
MFLDQLEDPAVSALVELAGEKAFGVAQAVEVVDTEDFRPRAGCGPAHVAQVVAYDPVPQLGVDEDGLRRVASSVRNRVTKRTSCSGNRWAKMM